VNHSNCYTIITAEKVYENFSLFLPFLPHLPLSYIGCFQIGKFPVWGKLLGLGFVTDKETEDFHSELPSSIAVLLAVRDCPHKRGNYSMFRQPGG
jgi:hypothetical protein